MKQKNPLNTFEDLLVGVGATRYLLWRKNQLGETMEALTPYGYKFYEKLVKLLNGAQSVAGINVNMSKVIDRLDELATITPEFEREWNTDLEAGFTFKGEYLNIKVSINDCSTCEGVVWSAFPNKTITIDGITYKFKVFGSIDDCGNFRTSGRIDAKGNLSKFAVVPYIVQENGELERLERIDDVDVNFTR